MAPPEKEESGTTGTLAVVGLACGFIGAVVGAFGWSAWKKEEGHQQHGYVIHSRVKVRVFVCCWLAVESLL